jgi:hypothetical protein
VKLRRSRARTPGCDYCASDDNMYYGHVEQVASSEPTQTLLLRCPRCGWLYEATASGQKDARRISEDAARLRFDYPPN